MSHPDRPYRDLPADRLAALLSGARLDPPDAAAIRDALTPPPQDRGARRAPTAAPPTRVRVPG